VQAGYETLIKSAIMMNCKAMSVNNIMRSREGESSSDIGISGGRSERMYLYFNGVYRVSIMTLVMTWREKLTQLSPSH
jgi:hypothetical protein